MSQEQIWLTGEQLAKIAPHLPTDTRGKARADDQWVISGIMHVLKPGGRWADAPPNYGPRKTLYNRFVRWAEKGVSVGAFETLAQAGGPPAQRDSIIALRLDSGRGRNGEGDWKVRRLRASIPLHAQRVAEREGYTLSAHNTPSINSLQRPLWVLCITRLLRRSNGGKRTCPRMRSLPGPHQFRRDEQSASLAPFDDRFW